MVVINHSKLLSCCFSSNIYPRHRTEECEQLVVFLRKNLCQDRPALGRPHIASPHLDLWCHRGWKVLPPLPTQSFQLWCHLGDFLLFTKRAVVEAVEGCRWSEHFWPVARVCCWDFRGRRLLCVTCRPSFECACVCGFSHGKPWQQVWDVVMGNYAAQGKTFAERGSPTVSAAKLIKEQMRTFNKLHHISC